jgi:hypothetical protein
MPAESTVRAWALDDRAGFSAQYARAREIGYHAMADETLEIADSAQGDYVAKDLGDNVTVEVVDHEHIARSRLRVDTRKWLLSKALPKVYGDRVALTGADGGPVAVKQLHDLSDDELAAIAAAGRARAAPPKAGKSKPDRVRKRD